MDKLTILLPQDNFPHEDLTDDNADLLSLLLLNYDTFTMAHTAAESLSALYRIGHEALIAAARPHIIQHESNALSHGIGVYETISAIVSPAQRNYRNTMLARPHMEMAYLAVSENFDHETGNLVSLFKNHRPNTSRVVEEAADRFHGGAVDYAIVGAALAYRLDMGTSVEEGRDKNE